jgi:hypothetical protein
MMDCWRGKYLENDKKIAFYMEFYRQFDFMEGKLLNLPFQFSS